MRIIHCAPFNIFTKSGGALFLNPIKISHGLVQNGHFVHNFDYRDTARYMSLFRTKKHGTKKMNQFFIDLIDDIKPDMIIFGHAELIYEETLALIKSKGIKMLHWYNDAIVQNGFDKVGHYFDIVLTTAAGGFIEEVQKYNKNAFFLPNLVDENVERHQAFNYDSYKTDILFAGRPDKDRAEFVDYLESHLSSDIRYKMIGHTKKDVILGESYLQALADAKICINHTRSYGVDYQWYTSDRLFHSLGCGSFAISRRIVGGEDFFEDKLPYYDTYDQFLEHALFYLDNEQLRKKNAQWLHNRVHTLFNNKRVAEYIIHLALENDKDLKKYEWYE
jgi:hypothetical protein